MLLYLLVELEVSNLLTHLALSENYLRLFCVICD